MAKFCAASRRFHKLFRVITGLCAGVRAERSVSLTSRSNSSRRRVASRIAGSSRNSRLGLPTRLPKSFPDMCASSGAVAAIPPRLHPLPVFSGTGASEVASQNSDSTSVGAPTFLWLECAQHCQQSIHPEETRDGQKVQQRRSAQGEEGDEGAQARQAEERPLSSNRKHQPYRGDFFMTNDQQQPARL
jgi:hypothetical protein